MPKYKVKVGDTLAKLSKLYGVKPEEILGANRISGLSQGQVINVPGITGGAGSTAANRAMSFYLNPQQPLTAGLPSVPTAPTRPVLANRAIGEAQAVPSSYVPTPSGGRGTILPNRYTDMSAYKTSEKTGGGTYLGQGRSTAGAGLRLSASEVADSVIKTNALPGAISFSQTTDMLSANPAFAQILSQYYVKDAYTGQYKLNALGMSANQESGFKQQTVSEGKYWEGNLKTIYDENGRAISPWDQDYARRVGLAVAGGVNWEEQNAQQRAALGGTTTGKSSTTGKDKDLRWWLKGK